MCMKRQYIKQWNKKQKRKWLDKVRSGDAQTGKMSQKQIPKFLSVQFNKLTTEEVSNEICKSKRH